MIKDCHTVFSVKYFSALCIFISLVFLSTFQSVAIAGEYSVFGPRIYLRNSGQPIVETDTILAVPASSYILKIYNGGLTDDGEYDRVSSSVILLNGGEFLTPNELNQNVEYIEKIVTLQELNELAVEVRGKPGGALIISIDGIDNTLPTITATTTPQANASGWHNTDVTVTFDCADSISGIASCTDPVTVTNEGANQVIIGAAIDKAGNTAEASVTLNIDKTDPSIAISSPLDGSLVTDVSLIVVGQILDQGSDVTAVLNGNAVSIQPDGNFSHSLILIEGINVLTLVATDSAGNTTEKTLSITLQLNQPPTAAPASVNVNEDTALNLTLLANDADGDVLTYQIVTEPINGVISGVASNLVYTPTENFSGSDSLSFKTNDGLLDSNIATITIIVNAINDAPVAQVQTITLAEDTSSNVVLTATDVDSSTLTYSVTAYPENGTLVGEVPNLVYTSNVDFNGSDSLTYSVSDGELTDVAQIDFVVTAVNDVPVSNDINLTTPHNTAVDIILSGTDIESDPLTYAIVTQPANGSLVGSNESFTYTPTSGFSGTDTLTYQVNDGDLNSAVATVTIVVEASIVPIINSEPVVVGFINKQYQYAVDATDPNGYKLLYSLSSSPVGMTIDPITGVINWSPTNEGDYPVTVVVENSSADRVEQSYQVSVIDAEPNHEGDDFWVLFSNNPFGRDGGNYLYLSSNSNTTGLIEATGAGLSIPFSITQGIVTVVEIDRSITANSGKQQDGIHITAEDKISVYGVNQRKFTTDGFLALPTRVLGTEYMAIDYTGVTQIDIVATEDNTIIEFISPRDLASRPFELEAGVPASITLNKSETYHLEKNDLSFSGVTVKSTKPIAVFSGHTCANVPTSFGTCDHLVEQMVPVKYWGTEFMSMPLAERAKGDTFVIVASKDNTVIKINNDIITELNKGDWLEKIIEGPSIISGNHPIMVAQFANGQSYDRDVTGDGTRDPFMMLLPAKEQFIQRYTFATPDDYIVNNYVNVIVPSAALSSLKLDAVLVDTNQFVQIGSTNFWGAQLLVGSGSHTIMADSPFGAAIYGFGQAESYGYAGGMLLPSLTDETAITIAPYQLDKQLTDEHCIDVSVSRFGVPINAARVDISIDGAHSTEVNPFTDLNGSAQYCYSGSRVGVDTFTVTVGSISQQGTINWAAVHNGDGNQSPVFTSTPVLDASVEFDYLYVPVAFDADPGESLTYNLLSAPVGMVISPTFELSWVPTETQVGDHEVTIEVEDISGNKAVQQYVVHVSQRNRAPEFITYPEQITAYVNHWYKSNVTAFDPDGDVFYYQPISGNIRPNTSSEINYYPSSADIGEQLAVIRVSDRIGAYTEIEIPVTVIKNKVPILVSEPSSQVKAGHLYESQLQFIDEDNTNNGVTYTLRKSPGGMTVDENGVIRWAPGSNRVGEYEVYLHVSDSVDIVGYRYYITVYDETQPFEATVTATPENIALGESTVISIESIGAIGAVSYTLSVNGIDVLVDNNGQATFDATDQYGVYEMVATANDGNFIVTTNNYFSVKNPDDTTLPVVSIESPLSIDKVTAPIPIVASISDVNLVKYQVFATPVSDPAGQILLAEGTTDVASAEIATFDPTLLVNGQYHITVVAVDTGGLQTADQVTVRVDGDLKVGNFSFTIEDMNVPMSGLPIRVTRTYDTRLKHSNTGLGYGWRLSYQDARVESSRALGDYWELNEYTSGTFGEIVDYCVEPQGAPYVTVVLSTGKMQTFEVSAEPRCNRYVPITDVKLAFTPVDNTQSTLELPSDVIVRLVNGGLQILGSNEAYNPTKFIMTNRQGFEYYLDKTIGIEKVIEPNGNTLTFTAEGIQHSDGREITIARGADNRVAWIRDFNNNFVYYNYNAAGDLITVTGHKNGTATYNYNYEHALTDMVNAKGITIIKNIYDDEGRLIAQENSDGERTNFDHNLLGRESVITNTRGYSTILHYDDEGNVLSEVDALGNISQFTYDSRGNQLSNIDALGNSVTATFNADNDQLTQVDALGNVVNFSYNQRGQELLISDAKGNTFENAYDSVGNLLSVTGPDGNVAGNNINAKGLVALTQDTLGNNTSYTYDETGNKITETDALGNTVTYSYDANANLLSESRQRMVDGALETQSTTYRYNSTNQIINIDNALGEYVSYLYNTRGQRKYRSGSLVGTERYSYDAYGRLIKTTFADSTTELKDYDGEGNLLSETDRLGNITEYLYDALDQLIKTTYPDGSTTQTQYDTVGRVIAEIDENNNRTEFEYDVAGRRILTRDALGFETNFTYDSNGNLTSQTDANGNTTSFEYDNLDNRIKTIYHDASEMLESYDALGRVTSKTDQNGLATTYGYDALGRLSNVTDAMGNITSYSYDEIGNKLTQTDAEGRTTSWSYDALGREISRTLPLQQSNSTTYNSRGNVTETTDFKGQLITYLYDLNDYLARANYSDGTSEVYTFDAEGNRSRVRGRQGDSEQWAYDSRDRLVTNTKGNGDQLDYSYDAVGNRVQLTVTTNADSATTDYVFDALNRLQSVTDSNNLSTSYSYDDVGNRQSVNYPNGNNTSYQYDALNRLTRLFTVDSLSNILTDYQYTLDNAGHRVQIIEHDGRTNSYVYDDLYRLTTEDITDAINGDYHASYSYDNVGNRIASTINGVQTQYTYDANDRLLQQGGETFTYDDNGNTISKTIDSDSTIFTYNVKNKLEQADITVLGANTQSSYQYDVDGIRNQQVVNGEAINYLADANRAYTQVIKETSATGNTDYLYGDDLIRQTKAANDSYYLYDGLGSTRALTDSIGDVTDSYDYESFGGTLNQTGATENSYLFTGEQYDAGLDNYYLRARYYGQSIGRFTQQDTWMGSNSNPITLHKYMYANVDPINNIDPSGNITLVQFAVGSAALGILTTVANPSIQIGNSDLSGSLDPLAPDHLTIGLLLLKNMVGTQSPLLSLLRDKDFGDEACTLVVGPLKSEFNLYSKVIYTCRQFPGGRHIRFIPSIVASQAPRKAPCAPGFPYDMMPVPIQEGVNGWKECHFRN